jgi:hypothetical protein
MKLLQEMLGLLEASAKFATDADGNLIPAKLPKLSLGAINAAIYRVAIASVKLPADVKADAQFTAKETDRFFSSQNDEVLSQLEKFADGRGNYQDDVLEAFYRALEDVGNEIIEYYSNKMNHAPGYQAPKIAAFDAEKVPSSRVIAELKKFPHWEEGVRIEKWTEQNQKNARKAKHASMVSPALIDKVVKEFDARFDGEFTDKIAKEITRDPGMFGLPNGYAPKTGAEVRAKILTWKPRDIIEWIIENSRKLSHDEISAALSSKKTVDAIWAKVSKGK